MGLKEKLFAVEKKLTKVNVPEIDEAVYVKVLSGAEYELYESQRSALKGTGGLRALIVSMTACDEKGALIFSEPAETDKVHTAILERLCHMALKVNGLTAASYEAYEKNC